MALALKRAGFRVLGVHGRRPKSVPRGLSLTVGERPLWLDRADVVLLAVRDDALDPLVRELARGSLRHGQLYLQLSGALTSRVLAPLARRGAKVGSFHPLMTVARDPKQAAAQFRGATFALEGDPAAVRAGRRLARALGGVPVVVRAAARPAYHAGAVFASNFVVAALAAAEDLLVKSGMTRRAARGALAPLARASVESSAAVGPAAALTGPIVRGDALTVRHHLAALDRDTRALYVALGKKTLALARRSGLSAAKARAVGKQLGSRRG
ncbi:MAG: Rossmann-like and DUF2520 domain-containing protein [Gemmatimonadales bacterium]